MLQATAEIGHNNPPSDMEVFAEKMKSIYGDTLIRAEKLIEAEARLPEVVNDDIESGKLGDIIKQLKSCDKSLNADREQEKEVYLKGSRLVDGFFNAYREKLKKIIQKAADIQAIYLKKKEDEERRIREEKAEAARLKAEEELREAQRKAAEAEMLRKQQAEESARVAAEAEAREKAIRDKAEADRKAAQDEIDRLNREAAEKEKADAETKRQLREAEAKLKDINKEERAELREVKADVRQAEVAVAGIGAAAKSAERESNKLLDTAARTEKQADRLDRHADASAADMARTRGLEGSLSTVSTHWVGSFIESQRDIVDIEALRYHLRAEDIDFAIKQAVKTGVRNMKGADIREEHKASVR